MTDHPDFHAAVDALTKSLAHYDRIHLDLTALNDAWQDLSHDQRRYLGQSFPKLCDVLLTIEAHQA